VRTFTSRVLAPIAAALLSIGMLAGPAIAAEDSTEPTEQAGDHAEDAGEHADESDAHDDEAEGFGTGEWDGLILAAIGGLLVGGLAFVSAGTGPVGKSDDHH
jgi:hypothetical protein